MDVKELKYFIACVEAGSFSEAAKTLYTTQSSVSKAIKMLEDSLGLRLFERLPRGIRLTAQGRQVYHYACKIVSEISVMEELSRRRITRWLRVSLNPSSWFSDRFVEFYNDNREENYHYQITTAGVRTVMERVRDYIDDVGFVYILERQEEEFRSELIKNKLTFTPLQETEVRVYPGKKNFLHAKQRSWICLAELEDVHFIQNYQDEFFDIEALSDQEEFGWRGMDITVLTNSDYIMERMLRDTDIANISGSYLSETKEGTAPGMILDIPKNKVVFGYILHKGEKPDQSVEKLIEFLNKKL